MSNRLPPSQRPESQPTPHDEAAVIELLALATIAIQRGLCSYHFPRVVTGIQKDIGHEPPAAVREMAEMMRIAHARGTRYTPVQVAGILRGRAAQIQRGENMRPWR